jgi:hypothetical protein
MNRSTFCWLLGLACLLIFLGLEPLLSFALFGSDTGEYYWLTAHLIDAGHLAPAAPAYPGWGSAYPSFPGIFLLAAATSGAVGADPFAALVYTIPVVAALSVLPLFLVFRRLFHHDLVALLGAGLAGVSMPRLFVLGHPVPQALGDFFVVAALWMFVEGRTDRRWYVPLALTSAALIVTHHLSSYFLLVTTLGGLLLLELWRPGAWSHRFPTRELLFIGGFGVALMAYWFYYAPALIRALQSSLHANLSALAPVALVGISVAVLVVGVLIHIRRRRTTRWGGPVRWPSDPSTFRDMAMIVGGTVAGLLVLAVVPVPPTDWHVSLAEIAYFLPYFAPFVLAAGAFRLTSLGRLGSYSIAWLGALTASAAVAIGAGLVPGPASELSLILLPSRHMEFLAVPLAFLLAIGVGRWVARAGDRGGRRALVAGGCAVVLLLAANAAIAYPPQAEFDGFQEGLTFPDQALWLWAGVSLAPGTTVASDHRLSSMLFGFDGLRATWDNTPCLFLGSGLNATCGPGGSAIGCGPGPGPPMTAYAELRGSQTPTCPDRPIETVAVDGVMYSGVALNPNAPALPLSAAARQWFHGPPFVAIYEDGPQAVYWVDLDPAP